VEAIVTPSGALLNWFPFAYLPVRKYFSATLFSSVLPTGVSGLDFFGFGQLS